MTCIFKYAMAAAALLACSCQGTRIDADDPGSRTDGYYDTPLWSIAVRYPDGYDWMKDSLGGNVSSQILVLRDTVTVLRLDASRDGPLRPEGDLHTIAGGHLVSHCASDDGTTCVLVDGKEVFRFDGRESIDHIIVKDNDIYTLGQGIESGGVYFRKNGELVFGQDNGTPLSPLYEDEEELCFSWKSPIASTSGQTAWRYYSYFGGKRQQLSTGADITAVHAIRRHNGQVHFLASSSIAAGILWEDEGESVCLDVSSEKIYEATLLSIGGKLCARLLEKENLMTLTLWYESYWNKDGKIVQTDRLRHICSISGDSPELFFATSAFGTLQGIQLWKNGEEYSLPQSCFMVSPNSLCCNEKYHCIGLNDSSDAKKRPLLIFRGDTARFDFNGYFTSLYLP